MGTVPVPVYDFVTILYKINVSYKLKYNNQGTVQNIIIKLFVGNN